MLNTKKIPEPAALLISVIIAQGAGVLGAFFTAPAIDTWYAYLNKPFFTPPARVFAPAWTLLYLLMGISAFLIWRKRNNPARGKILLIYGAHLALNAMWSVVFFGMRNPQAAFAVIILLAAMISVLTVRFYRVEKAAGILFIPYLAWVLFASSLNLGIIVLN